MRFTVCVVAIEKQVRDCFCLLILFSWWTLIITDRMLSLLNYSYTFASRSWLLQAKWSVVMEAHYICWERCASGRHLTQFSGDVCHQVFRTCHRFIKKCFGVFYSQVSCFVAVTSDSHPFCPNADKCSWFQPLKCYIISHGHRVHLNQDLYIIEHRMTSVQRISNSMFPRAWLRMIPVSNVCPVTS